MSSRGSIVGYTYILYFGLRVQLWGNLGESIHFCEVCILISFLISIRSFVHGACTLNDALSTSTRASTLQYNLGVEECGANFKIS